MITTISRTACMTCLEPVLLAPTLGGLPVMAEVPEILPRERCRACLSERLLRERCWRCGAQPWDGTERRWVGEDLGGVLGVGIDPHGHARIFICGTRPRLDGEAVHRAHQCSLAVPALAA